MFIINSILWINSLVDVSFEISKDIKSVFIDITTFPSTWATWSFTTITPNFWEIDFTISFSKIVFSLDNTIMDFTFFNPLVIVLVTSRNEDV
jgi:hypothetical protein